MLKTILIASILALTQALQIHQGVISKQGGKFIAQSERSPDKKDGGYNSNSASVSDCYVKRVNDECKLGGKCMNCAGVFQCRYHRQCGLFILDIFGFSIILRFIMKEFPI